MHEHKSLDKILLGFWVYLMTDLLMFSVLFATFAVLRNNTFGAATIWEIFNPPFVLTETTILLVSSFTCGLANIATDAEDKTKTLLFLAITFLLGLSFLGMELYEFSSLVMEGNAPSRSAFLSSFFTLVGTHGLHILAGLIWIGLLLYFISKRGLTDSNKGKVKLLSYFWHFLDIVWIFIFTFVYLMGAVS